MVGLLDRLLGRTKKPTPPATPQLASVEVAAPTALPEGANDVPGATVQLTAAATADTFVTVTSGDPTALVVTGGGVTVPAAQTSASVVVSVLRADASVTLAVTLGTQTLEATLVTGSGPAG